MHSNFMTNFELFVLSLDSENIFLSFKKIKIFPKPSIISFTVVLTVNGKPLGRFFLTLEQTISIILSKFVKLSLKCDKQERRGDNRRRG